MGQPIAFNYNNYVSVLKTVSADAKTLKGELCLRCGQYREAHKGACDGCRWKDYDPEVYTNG